MPSQAIGIIPSVLGLFGGSKKSSGSAAAEQAAAGQNALNEAQRQILNDQLALWQQYYKPVEEGVLGVAPDYLKQIPMVDIASQTIDELRQPYQLPPQVRMQMLEQIRSRETQALDTLKQQLTSQGISGGQLANALANVTESFLPARYGLERDIALETALKEEQRKLQAFNLSQGIYGMLANLGMAGRAIPGWATSTLGNMAGQYGQAAAAAAQMSPYLAQQQNAMWQNLGTSLAGIFNQPKQTTYTAPTYNYSSYTPTYDIRDAFSAPVPSNNFYSTFNTDWKTGLP